VKSCVSWDNSTRSPLRIKPSFGGIYRLHRQDPETSQLFLTPNCTVVSWLHFLRLKQRTLNHRGVEGREERADEGTVGHTKSLYRMATRWGANGSFPLKCKNSSPRCPHRLRSHVCFLSSEYQRILPRWVRRLGREADESPLYNAEVKKYVDLCVDFTIRLHFLVLN
jgi:hypothetical protein